MPLVMSSFLCVWLLERENIVRTHANEACLFMNVTKNFATCGCVMSHMHDSRHACGCVMSNVRVTCHIRTSQTTRGCQRECMGWLQLVGSLKLYVTFAKEPYKRKYILQKRPIILRSLLIEASP